KVAFTTLLASRWNGPQAPAPVQVIEPLPSLQPEKLKWAPGVATSSSSVPSLYSVAQVAAAAPLTLHLTSPVPTTVMPSVCLIAEKVTFSVLFASRCSITQGFVVGEAEQTVAEPVPAL